MLALLGWAYFSPLSAAATCVPPAYVTEEAWQPYSQCLMKQHEDFGVDFVAALLPEEYSAFAPMVTCGDFDLMGMASCASTFHDIDFSEGLGALLKPSVQLWMMNYTKGNICGQTCGEGVESSANVSRTVARLPSISTRCRVPTRLTDSAWQLYSQCLMEAREDFGVDFVVPLLPPEYAAFAPHLTCNNLRLVGLTTCAATLSDVSGPGALLKPRLQPWMLKYTVSSICGRMCAVGADLAQPALRGRIEALSTCPFPENLTEDTFESLLTEEVWLPYSDCLVKRCEDFDNQLAKSLLPASFESFAPLITCSNFHLIGIRSCSTRFNDINVWFPLGRLVKPVLPDWLLPYTKGHVCGRTCCSGR